MTTTSPLSMSSASCLVFLPMRLCGFEIFRASAWVLSSPDLSADSSFEASGACCASSPLAVLSALWVSVAAVLSALWVSVAAVLSALWVSVAAVLSVLASAPVSWLTRLENKLLKGSFRLLRTLSISASSEDSCLSESVDLRSPLEERPVCAVALKSSSMAGVSR